MNNPQLAPEGLRAAALAIAADTPLGQMHRAIEIAQKAITAYLGSTGAVAPEPPAFWHNGMGQVLTPAQKADEREQVASRYDEPLYTHPAPADTGQGGGVEAATHRHKKRGSEYVLVGFGKMQAENWFAGPPANLSVIDMREVAIYRSVDDGSLWVRPREEFEDGRFAALNAGART
jgi:hypothetical protein